MCMQWKYNEVKCHLEFWAFNGIWGMCNASSARNCFSTFGAHVEAYTAKWKIAERELRRKKENERSKSSWIRNKLLLRLLNAILWGEEKSLLRKTGSEGCVRLRWMLEETLKNSSVFVHTENHFLPWIKMSNFELRFFQKSSICFFIKTILFNKTVLFLSSENILFKSFLATKFSCHSCSHLHHEVRPCPFVCFNYS